MDWQEAEPGTSTALRVGIADIAIYLPEKIESAEKIAEKTGIPRRVIEEKFGIRERRIAARDEHASDLAVKAARAILQKTDPDEIDALIYCGSPFKDYPVWSCAPKIQYELGLKKAFTFEIMNMSAGFSTAIKTAKDMLIADPFLKNILLVAGTRESGLIDPSNPRTHFMINFSDGGAALLLRKGLNENVILESFFHTDGSFYHHVKVPAGGSVMPAGGEALCQGKYFVDICEFEDMKSKLNRVSAGNFIKVILKAMARSGYGGAKPDFLALLHIKPLVFKHILGELGINESQSFYLNKYGHMSSLDIVVALHEGLQAGRVRDGHLVVAACAGTGYTWGANVIKWGKYDK